MNTHDIENSFSPVRPKTAQTFLLPQPFGSSIRMGFKEAAPRTSLNDLIFTGFHGFSNKDDQRACKDKSRTRLKKTIKGVVMSGVEKMTSHFGYTRSAVQDSRASRAGRSSRRGKSISEKRMSTSGRVEKSGSGLCNRMDVKMTNSISRCIENATGETFDGSTLATRMPLSPSNNPLLPHDFHPTAGAGARAAVQQAATLKLGNDQTDTFYPFGQHDSPIETPDNYLGKMKEHRDDSVYDDYMDIDDIDDICTHREVKTYPDPAPKLPLEIVDMIFSHLDLNSLVSASRVSWTWNSIVEKNATWRSLYLKTYSPQRYSRDAPKTQLQIGGRGLGRSDRCPQDFKAMAKARRQIDQNWQKHNPKAIYFNGHTDSVYCCQFDEKKIITGSRDRTIRVWDMNTLRCLRVIGSPANKPTKATHPRLEEHKSTVHTVFSVNGTREGDDIYHVPAYFHNASILCLQYDDKILVSGSSDTTCIVWDVDTFEPIARLRCHTAGVLDICFDDTFIVSCSKDWKICVWSRKTYELLNVLEGHRGPVNAVQMRGKYLVSASGDGSARLWDMETMQEVRQFASEDRGLAAVEFSDDARFILAGGNDQVIYKYDISTTECVMKYEGHDNLVRSLFLDSQNGRVLSGSYDQGMRVYDFQTGADMGVYNNWTTSWILAAKSDYRRIVATSQDGRVLMMDFGWDVENAELLADTAVH
ncbi:WD40 repeat-like protein [Microthyrium microscopicum]|uniref:WD40 repeat-like protein n=1 Tax=Microthyrium microscopicum TaxID=703497 RepID=A0A6A6TYF3_9PEZI|nr:WD40 repeat-like protein [Microthyrium microscopicum]